MIKRLRTLIALAALAPVAGATTLWDYTSTSLEGGRNNTGGTTADGINNNNRIVGFNLSNALLRASAEL